MLHKARTGNSQLLRHKCATAKKQFRVANYRYDENRTHIKNDEHTNSDNSITQGTIDECDESIDEVDRSASFIKTELMPEQEPTAWVKAGHFSEYGHYFPTNELSQGQPSLNLLSREELSFKIAQKDPGIEFGVNREHPNWKQFALIYYNSELQSYLRCISCSTLIRGDKRTSIAYLSRHKCTEADAKPISPLFSPSLLLQAKLVYKSLRSPELFDDPNFSDFCASLVDNQTQPELANRHKMTEKILPLMVDRIKEEIKAEINTVHACLSYDLWAFDSHRKVFTLYGDWINHEFQIKRYCLGSVFADTKSDRINLDPLINAILKEYMEDVVLFKKKKCFLMKSQIVMDGSIKEIFATDIEFVNCSLEQLSIAVEELLKTSEVEYIKALKDSHGINNLRDLLEFIDSVITTDDSKFDEFLNQLKILKEFGVSVAQYRETSVDTVFLWRIKLIKHFTPLDEDHKHMAAAKKVFLDAVTKHIEIRDLHKIAVFLNPKFKHLKFITRAERNEFEDLIMSKINEQLIEFGLDPNTFEIRTMPDAPKPNEKELFAEFMETNPGSFTLADSLKNEVRQYIDSKISGNGDLLPYWRHSNFEDLRKLVVKILMIPACSPQSRMNYLNLDEHLLARRKTLDLVDIQNVLFLYHNMP